MSMVVDGGITDKKHSAPIAKLFVKLVQIAVGLDLVPQTGFPLLWWCDESVDQFVRWCRMGHGSSCNHCNWEINFYTICCDFWCGRCEWYSCWVRISGGFVILNVGASEIGWQKYNPCILMVIVQVEYCRSNAPVPFKVAGMCGIPFAKWFHEFGSVVG